ncbi:ArnT family glycosyltransferase [Schleiferilactobacillus perolens]|uniref:ArnT-like N-terminal domain-containing protein n=1 Tax=Schleiferilactobacillus perolens DSM 12744 TaxID=1423792 RepID=A0A0R1MWP9_9LACO|nr:glycosyltransferase family 39 protein [Schleiferilactobacillus perolens]KRL12566.1 hypothetical protein FD09_GL002885 [Schleiferilactobacillus perolens DSM 12744]
MYIKPEPVSAPRFNVAGRWLHIIFWIVFGLLSAFTLLGSSLLIPSYWPFFLLMVPVFAVLAFTANRYHGNHFLWWLLAIALIARIVGLIIFHPAPESDFLVQYNAAQDILKGNLAFNKGYYFASFPYQVGFSFYEAVLLRIFNSIWTLRIVNLLLSTGSVWLVYLLAHRFSTKQFVAQFAGLAYALFATPIAYNGVLTNNIASTFFTLLSLYFVTLAEDRDHGWLWVALAGFVLSVGNFLRPDGLALIVAVGAYFFFGLFTPQWRKRLLNLVVIAVAFFGFNAVFSAGVSASGLAPAGMKVLDPYWKFATGIELSSNGQYSNRVLARTKVIKAEKHLSQHDASKAMLMENIQNLRKAGIKSAARLAVTKQNVFWFGKGGLIFPTIELQKTHPRLVRWYDGVKTMWMLGIFILALFSLWPMLHKGYDRQLLMVFFIFTFAVVNLVTETQYRYSFSVQPMWFIMAGLGLEWWLSKVQDR